MLLLRAFELIALIGLFVQTFVAWVFIVVLAALGNSEGAAAALRSFRRAFGALAVALTLMSVRFLQAHHVDVSARWPSDSWQVLSCYAGYMATKALFAFLLVTACNQLVGRRVPATLRRLTWPCVVLLALSPLTVPGINELLMVQAPVMIVCSLAALSALRASHSSGSGIGILRGALVGLAVTWVLHSVAVLARGTGWAHYVLSLNSYADLAVQLGLGIGLIVSVLQEAQQRRIVAEREREDLRAAFEHDEKLRALGAVVSGVAHELNNPLTVILGYAEILNKTNPQGSESAVIAEQAERCRGIVRNLSALAGQSVHPREPLVIEDLAQRVVRGLASADLEDSDAEAPRILVEPMGDLTIEADRTGLEQVLANLVANARHATSSQGTVTLSAERAGSNVEIRISDDGPGVPAELRERVFEPFFSTKGPGGGTGLGLSIAHAIVRAHDGAIRIEDGPHGRGASFVITLPTAGPSVPPPRSTPTPNDRTRSLLIIDDEEPVRSILAKQAVRRGWGVTETDSAESALEHDLAAYDVILCDLRMPGIGGVGLHDRLRAEQDSALARCVFVTGDLASTDSLGFLRRCEQPTLAKPFDFDELFAELAARADEFADQEPSAGIGGHDFGVRSNA